MTPRLLMALLLMAFAPEFLAAQSNLQGEPKLTGSRVEVFVFNEIGNFISSAQVDAFVDYRGENHASMFHDLVAERVDSGDYRLRVSARDFEPVERTVSVFEPQKTVVVGMLVVDIGDFDSCDPPSLSGRISGGASGDTERAIVKAAGVFSDLSVEAPIGPDGKFELTHLSGGPALLLVASKAGIWANRIVNIPKCNSGPPIEIQIDGEPTAHWR